MDGFKRLGNLTMIEPAPRPAYLLVSHFTNAVMAEVIAVAGLFGNMRRLHSSPSASISVVSSNERPRAERHS